jgi:hypothetical protein
MPGQWPWLGESKPTAHNLEIFFDCFVFGDRIRSVVLVREPHSHFFVRDSIVLFLDSRVFVAAVLEGVQEEQVERIEDTDDSQDEHDDGQGLDLVSEYFVEDDGG